MSLTGNPGRVAGFLYLLLGFSVIRPFYVGSALIVRGNAIATVNNIAAHESLFRFGIATDLLTGVSCIVVAVALYRVFKPVNQDLAALMVILGGLMPCAVGFFNVLNDVATLFLARGGEFLSVMEKPQRAALAMLFLRVHDHGFLINEIFAGLWLLPFGILVFRSRSIPRFIGVWLVININGLAYVLISFTGLLAPNYVDRVSRATFPALAGEGAIMLWLMIKGAKCQPAGDAGALPIAVKSTSTAQ